MGDVADVHLPAGFIRAVSAAADQEAVLRATASWMPKIISAERSSVALPLDEHHLAIRSIGGTIPLSGPKVHAIAGSIVGEAFTNAEPLVIDDLCEPLHERHADANALRSAGLRSAIVGPLISGGRCLGTINLANSKVGFFTESHVELLGSVADLVASFLNVHQLAEAEKIQAATDDLTGGLSRRAALAELERMLQHPDGKPSVLFIDVDGFKRINDVYGHRTGDEVLRQIAQRITPLLDADDRFGRLGGDEFIAIVHADPVGERAAELAAAIVLACKLPALVDDVQVKMALSIGIGYAHSPDIDASALLGDADHAMYTAKGCERSIVVADDAVRQQVGLVAAIDRDVDAAMARGEIVFHYQPVRHLKSLALLGAEALIRWNHPKHGFVPPPLLIERIEATGRIPQFTTWAMDTIARDLQGVRQQVPTFTGKSFALNLTPGQLSWRGCAAAHAETCDRYGFDRADLLVEVVESSEIQPNDAAEQTLKQMASEGAFIALDDFGVGHNALAYFTRFPIHLLKLDQSLVRGMAENEAARSILRGLTSMARELGIISLAEGVETIVEEAMCREAGIHHGQGWHFGRPIPIADFTELALTELGGVSDLAA
jgi:diguanylate cyclase (GGDEF)-like protein